METNTESVRYFTSDDAPPHWITQVREAGWYWRDAEGQWSGPAPGGKAQARHHAGASIRA